jgi:glycerol-3-phosphate O-acyltransferase / dihydroxyacetone phosphate acyltransferase
MALGALHRNPNLDLKIIPCGMNYFHPHKFRSRAVIEFGVPLTVPPALIQKYADPSTRRDAIKVLLDMIYHALLSVTVNTPDYETLQVVQAARRLYKPAHRRLPLPQVVELNRRFVEGYTHFGDDPQVIKLRNDVLAYNRRLRMLGIRDHQVQNARVEPFSVLGKLIYQSIKVTVLGLGALPGVILFGPVFIATKVISHHKAKEALAASTVKIRGRDVLATWKFLVALGLVPTLYFVYACLITYCARRWDIFGWGPDSRLYLLLIPLCNFFVLPSISFAALRFGEIGMDIYKYAPTELTLTRSMPPLLFSLNPSNRGALSRLKQTRETLSAELTSLINTLGPEIFPDFDASRIIASSELPPTEPHHLRRRSSHSHLEDDMHLPIGSPSTQCTPVDLPHSEKFDTLADVPLFASRPPSRTGRRSRSTSIKEGVAVEKLGGLSVMSKVSDEPDCDPIHESFDEITRRIKGGLAARRMERVSNGPGKKDQ